MCYRIFSISYVPDASAHTDDGITGNKGDSSAVASTLEITTSSQSHGAEASNISLIPTSLQMEVSALDSRRDVDVELDGPVPSSDVQQKFGKLPSVAVQL